ncbi:hypothetical protein GCM10022261_22160 [Brevibacterium daeguense]|uniref:DUF4232 domain-containing protein n=1 Tax=Brevibacterium daeguense TaxID=909936 RepID=A0ABP8ELF1_9MICO|nr:hypothetical protein [Brevibacterium daeguense]
MYRRRRLVVGALALAVAAAAVVGIILLVQAVGDLATAGDADPVAAPTESAEPTAPVPTGDAASGACPPEAVVVGAAVEKKSFEPGDSALLELVVKNTHHAACMIPVGTSLQTFEVRRDGDTVWSSEYCADPEADADAAEASIVFAPGAEKRSALRWTIEPVTEDCRRSDEALAGGKYQLVTKLGEAESTPAEFEIDVPEPPSEPPSEEPPSEQPTSDESSDEADEDTPEEQSDEDQQSDEATGGGDGN